MEIPTAFLLTLPWAMFVATLLWLASLVVRDASIIDRFWGLGFVAVAFSYVPRVGLPDTRGRLLLLLVTLWGVRLSAHIIWRNWGRGEDRRYKAMRETWGRRFPIVSLFNVFHLQAVLLWLISAPLFVATQSQAPAPLVWSDAWGAALVLIGLYFETVADYQLAAFKADPRNEGKVLHSGLWRYSRHPNYFGDFLVWWGFFALAQGRPNSMWAIVSPLIMSFLLLKVSGVTLLERDLQRSKPDYRHYTDKTNAFFPWFPR